MFEPLLGVLAAAPEKLATHTLCKGRSGGGPGSPLDSSTSRH